MSENAPEILRLKIREIAESHNIYDRKVPSRTYCAIIIQAMAKLLGMSVHEMTRRIESQHSSS